MDIAVPLLKLLAGIGLFLFSMYLVEQALKNLSGRKFKRFLQRISKHRLGAVAGGAITTGVLQSSSIVSVMVLSFVGTGVFTMRNAIAIILGANLGTTLASWLVLLFGFEYNIEMVSYPVVFAGGLLLILFEKRKTLKYLAYFLVGFGLLFISISIMKTAMEAETKAFDFSRYAHLGPAVFLIIGFILTLIIQSSSATMAIALTAMHAGAIELAPAAAIVLGSETGTTIRKEWYWVIYYSIFFLRVLLFPCYVLFYRLL
jgi:phosphate:Na+ symporter